MNKIILTLITFFFISNSEAQHRLAYLSYVFPNDSLSGFNENTAKQEALCRGFFGTEFKVFMYRTKRNYINQKYGYLVNITSFNKNFKPVINSTPCLNEDFESSPTGSISGVSGWMLTEGSYSIACKIDSCIGTTGTGLNTWIRSTPYNIPTFSITVPNSPLGGSKVIQMNDELQNMGEIVRLEQTFPVTSSNTGLQYAVYAFMEQPPHVCCDQPGLNISLYDCLNNLIPAATFSLIAPGANCTNTVSNWINSSSGFGHHTGWQIFNINLSAYIGSCVKLQATVNDCDAWVHQAFCFFDVSCGPLNIAVNGNLFVPTGTINACGNTATMNAGTGPVIWDGPLGSGIASNTNVAITTTTQGTYTLTTGTGTNTIGNIFTLNINPLPTVSLTASSMSACVNGPTISLTGSPSGGVFPAWPNIVGNIFTPPGIAMNYPITYTYTNPTTSCSATASVSILIKVCTDIEEEILAEDGIKIYPNPTNGEFTITSNHEIEIQIANELGQVFKEIKLSSVNNYLASVTNLASGIYFVTGKNFKEKIVVTK